MLCGHQENNTATMIKFPIVFMYSDNRDSLNPEIEAYSTELVRTCKFIIPIKIYITLSTLQFILS